MRPILVVLVGVLAACGGSSEPAPLVTAAAHESCFPIGQGNHAGIACLDCHVSLPTPLVVGSCSSVPYPACSRCHACSAVSPGHAGIPGFTCVILDQRCYECHARGTRLP